MEDYGPEGASNALEQRVARLEDAVASLRAELDARRGPDPLPPRPGPSLRTAPQVTALTGAAAMPRSEAPVHRFESLKTAASPEASLETRIGSQLFNRIGIVALLIGVAWFLKLAIDNQWIGAGLRIVIGLLLGAGLVLWSERFRAKGFAAFSYSLKAVGSGVLYLTLWASFQLYHLLPAWAALLAMVGVTCWNAVMALLQDAELLAVYALVGGFVTPALLSTGGNHEIFLFSYVLAMDVAVALMLSRKPWQRLLLGSLPGTVAYFIGWYVKFWSPDEAGTTALFAVLLALPFVLIPMLGWQRESAGEGVWTPLAAAAFLAGSLYSVLEDSGRHGWLPWMAVALGAVYLGLAQARRRGAAEAVHLSLAVAFLTIAIPLKASGHWITVGWLVEGVALMWMAAHLLAGEFERRVRMTLLWLGAGAIWLGFVRSATGWFDDVVTQPIWNTRFCMEMLAAASLASAGWIAARARPVAEAWKVVGAGAVILFNVLMVEAGVREIVTYFGVAVGGDAGLAEAATISVWLMLYAALLLMAGFWKRSAFLRWQGLGLLVFTIAKVFVYDMRNLSSGYRVLSFIGLGALLMAVSFAYQRDWLGLRDADVSAEHEAGE